MNFDDQDDNQDDDQDQDQDQDQDGAEVEGGAEQDLSEETKKVLVKIGPPKGKKRMVSLPYTSVAT